MRKETEVAFDLGMIQTPEEIEALLDFYDTLDVKNFLEIGTEFGGTFYLFCNHPNLQRAVSVDLPSSFVLAKMTAEARQERLKSYHKNVFPFILDSHSVEALESVKKVLDGEQLDFLFIDGDHSYEGAKQDFDTFSPFVKKGGWVGFHDMNEGSRKGLTCPLAWDEASRGRKTLVFDAKNHAHGIGLLQM